jgi:hypothetical protein
MTYILCFFLGLLFGFALCALLTVAATKGRGR